MNNFCIFHIRRKITKDLAKSLCTMTHNDSDKSKLRNFKGMRSQANTKKMGHNIEFPTPKFVINVSLFVCTTILRQQRLEVLSLRNLR